MVDDEMISAYVDGQLNEAERAALEARMRQDSALRQRIALTQLLKAETRQLPTPPLPRHFALPAQYARPPQRRWWDGRWLFRAASLMSAGVCAVLLAIDAGQWTSRTAQVPQAVARTMTPILQTNVALPAETLALVTSSPLPNQTYANTEIAPKIAPDSMARSASMAPSVSMAPSTSTTTSTPVAASVAISTPEPIATHLATVLPTGPTMPEAPFTVSQLPRLLALLTGLAAMLFAGLGWLKR